jgi:hypothetical protein
MVKLYGHYPLLAAYYDIYNLRYSYEKFGLWRYQDAPSDKETRRESSKKALHGGLQEALPKTHATSKKGKEKANPGYQTMVSLAKKLPHPLVAPCLLINVLS